MAQNLTIAGASYTDVPGLDIAKTGGGTAYFADVSDTTAAAADVASGKYFYTAAGVRTVGTASGGGGGGVIITETPNAAGGDTLEITGVELSSDTVAANSMLYGVTAHDSSGTAITGTIQSVSGGTPTATKGTVSNHSISVTPSVTNSTGYITGSTINGTAVTVTASELASGNKEITSNGTNIDVVGFSTVSVSVGGTSKNVQVVQGTTRTASSTMTAIGAELTVSKSGTYDIYWSGFRTNTSTSYTYATQLYIDGVAYGSENAAWTYHQQNNHLTSVSLTVGQKLRIYGRESRNTSNYMYAGSLIIIEN